MKSMRMSRWAKRNAYYAMLNDQRREGSNPQPKQYRSEYSINRSKNTGAWVVRFLWAYSFVFWMIGQFQLEKDFELYAPFMVSFIMTSVYIAYEIIKFIGSRKDKRDIRRDEYEND